MFMEHGDQGGIVWVGKPLATLIRELDLTVGKPLEQPCGSKLVRDCSYTYLNLGGRQRYERIPICGLGDSLQQVPEHPQETVLPTWYRRH
jgi:hypothetical protein